MANMSFCTIGRYEHTNNDAIILCEFTGVSIEEQSITKLKITVMMMLRKLLY